MSSASDTPAASTTRLAALFASLYFVQGLVDANDGLLAQPLAALLKSWHETPGQIASFSALLALAWAAKPLYGLLTDFVPVLGLRRKSYLVITSVLASAGFLWLYAVPPAPGAHLPLLLVLVVPSVAVAFADVVIDALMVERSQPLGLTGRMQSVQWGAAYTAMLLTGIAGGLLSEAGLVHISFLLCGLLALATAGLTLACVREPRYGAGFQPADQTYCGAGFQPADHAGETPAPQCFSGFQPADHAGETPAPQCFSGDAGETLAPQRVLAAAVCRRELWGVCLFLFCFEFNPFTMTVLYLHMTETLGLGEAFYGLARSLAAGGAMTACFVYGRCCRRVSRRWLVHGAIVLGIAASAAFCGMIDRTTACVAWTAFGFTYTMATLAQLDLAAQACPIAAAGTVFASIMALANLSSSLATWAGGHLYETASQSLGPMHAYNLLVVIGMATTALCWLAVPLLRTSDGRQENASSQLDPARQRADSGTVQIV